MVWEKNVGKNFEKEPTGINKFYHPDFRKKINKTCHCLVHIKKITVEQQMSDILSISHESIFQTGK